MVLNHLWTISETQCQPIPELSDLHITQCNYDIKSEWTPDKLQY